MLRSNILDLQALQTPCAQKLRFCEASPCRRLHSEAVQGVGFVRRPHKSFAFVRKGFVSSWLQIYDLQPFDLQGCARGRFCKGLLSFAEQAANQGIGFVSGGFVSVARNRLGP